MMPCSIFMTFETEEGINRALIFDDAIKADKSLENLQYWIQGVHKVKIQEAPLPMDIIWENRQVSTKTRRNRNICAKILVYLMLIGSSGI